MDAKTDPDLISGTRRPPSTPPFGEFVAIVALMIGFTAFAVDNLLPALPAIGADFGVADPNSLQFLVYVYIAGFGSAQLVYGPLSDRFGRRPVLMAGIAIFVFGCLLSLASTGLTSLLFARFVQGLGAAAGRVLSIAVVRDRFVGREMARVMSLTTVVFIMVPVFAPTIGSGLLLLGSWRFIFAAMLGLALVLAIWFGLRMPETLRPEYRRPLSVRAIGRGFATTITTRTSIGYATAFGLCFACILSFVGSSQQIFGADVYRLGPLFPVAFGGIAATMGLAAFLNSRLVTRFGMRRIVRFGVGTLLVLVLCQLLGALATGGRPPLPLFGPLLAASLFLVMLVMPNLNAMTMEPLGSIAGTASSLIGAYTTLMGAAIGSIVGHFYDGTVLPLVLGHAVLSACAVVMVLWTERGVPFEPTR